MKLKHVLLGLSLCLVPITADAQIISQDNVFGDNIVQNNYYPGRHRVVRKRSRAIAVPAPVILRPRGYYLVPGYYGYFYYPPGSFY